MTDPVQPEKPYPMPFTRIEVVVLGIVDGQLQVLLAKRTATPQAGRWALPGGVLRIDLDDGLRAAAERVVRERLGLGRLPSLRQLYAVGGPTRDPRAPWALSVVYRALIVPAAFQAAPGKRIEALAWRPADEATNDTALAFDHGTLIADAVATSRQEVERLDIPFGCLDARFTLGELQAFCEQLLGRTLDKSSFRRRLADRDLVQPVAGQFREGAFRPAQLYRPNQMAKAETLSAVEGRNKGRGSPSDREPRAK